MRAGVLGALALLAATAVLLVTPEPAPPAPVALETRPPSDEVGPPPPVREQGQLVQADPMAASWAFLFALAVGVAAVLLLVAKRTS